MASIILDTHVLIWLAEDPVKLSQAADRCIYSNNKLFISNVTIWEMAVKIKTGKLRLQFPLEEFIEKAMEKHTLSCLHIFVEHIYYTQHLPLHHSDPFDRLLIAQAIVEDFRIVSSDTAWDAYRINRIWNS